MSLPCFDIDLWLDRFPLGDEQDIDCQELGVQSGPRDIVFLEQMRAKASEKYDLGPDVPTDVFLWSLGLPPMPYCTKLGGAPYRSTSVPWPKGPDGKPLVFLAQFCFAESHDIVGNTPGEVLLVFSRGREIAFGIKRDYLYFEWHDIEPDVFIDDGQTALSSWTIPRVYGNRFRSCDYCSSVAGDAARDFIAEADPNCEYPEVYASSLCRVSGTKIGGCPHWKEPHEEAEKLNDARFLCALACFVPRFAQTYPFVNREAPISVDQFYEDEYAFKWAEDDVVINIFLDGEGKIHWRR